LQSESVGPKVGTRNLLKVLLNAKEAPSEEKSKALSSIFARNYLSVMFVSPAHGAVLPLTRAWAPGLAQKM